MKIGLFGGTFDPPHLGHLSAMTSVQKKLGLKKVFAVPAFQNPLKEQTDGATPDQRIEMLELAIRSWSSNLTMDSSEALKPSPSYTIDTVRQYRKDFSASEIYLIIGQDNFISFSQWKEADELLRECNLVVVSRPGFDFPTAVTDLPQFFADRAREFDFNLVELKSGRTLEFVQIENSTCSGTDIRKRLRAGLGVSDCVPLSVESYIREKRLYQPMRDRILNEVDFVKFCVQQLADKKGFNMRALDVRGLNAPSDFIVVASGTSSRHAASLGQNLVSSVKKEFKILPQGLEGTGEGRWVLVDYGVLIVHVFYDFIRNDYNLESLYPQAKVIDVSAIS